MEPGPVAFVLSGGGNMGALQVGMLRALLERDIVPDIVVGCSVGALNGAALAEDPTLAMVDRLEEVWLSLDSRDLVPGGLLPTIVHLDRRGVSMHGNEAFRDMIARMISAETFEALTVPFQAWPPTSPPPGRCGSPQDP
ncbi:MAG: patatin-like phospholipase family protein [Acidimicrobiales bacterium]